MSDAPTTTTTPTTTTDPATTTTDPATTDTGATTDWKSEAEKWKELARKHEGRSKENATAAKELEQLKAQHMTEQEKAVEEARNAGRTEGQATMGAKLVRAEFRAAAAGRLEADQLTTLLEGLNLTAFLTDDGEVDEAKVAKYVDGIAPKADPNAPATRRFPDLGQGARGNGTGGTPDAALNGDPLLRDLKSKLGIT